MLFKDIKKNIKITFFYLISFIFILIFLESFSYVGLYSYYKYKEIKNKKTYTFLFENLSIKNHPFFSKKLNSKSNYTFDHLYQADIDRTLHITLHIPKI